MVDADQRLHTLAGMLQLHNDQEQRHPSGWDNICCRAIGSPDFGERVPPRGREGANAKTRRTCGRQADKKARLRIPLNDQPAGGILHQAKYFVRVPLC